MLRRRLTLTTCAAALVAAAPAPAATIAPDVPCVREGQAVPFTGTGFAPGAQIQVGVDGGETAAFAAGPDGVVRGAMTAPYGLFAPNGRAVALNATDGTNAAAGSVSSVAGDATLVPRSGSPGRVRLRAAGLSNRRPVYAHARKGGRWVRTVKLASRPQGACGTIVAGTGRLLRGLSQSVYLQIDGTRRARLSTRPQTWIKVAVQPSSPAFPRRTVRFLGGGFRL